jgi:hypothetical protein
MLEAGQPLRLPVRGDGAEGLVVILAAEVGAHAQATSCRREVEAEHGLVDLGRVLLETRAVGTAVTVSAAAQEETPVAESALEGQVAPVVPRGESLVDRPPR